MANFLDVLSTLKWFEGYLTLSTKNFEDLQKGTNIFLVQTSLKLWDLFYMKVRGSL